MRSVVWVSKPTVDEMIMSFQSPQNLLLCGFFLFFLMNPDGVLMRFLLPVCLLIMVASCNNTQPNDLAVNLQRQNQPVVNGEMVTGDDYLSTTMLAYDVAEHYGEQFLDAYGKLSLFCSSTLITPNYVLTAAHCICNSDRSPIDLDEYRRGVYVFAAQSVYDARHKYEIEAFYPHPNYPCDYVREEGVYDDIAIIKLKNPVPLSEIKPVSPLPPSLAIQASEVDSAEGVTVVDVGFGITKDQLNDPNDTKHVMVSKVFGYCPKTEEQSDKCKEPVPMIIDHGDHTHNTKYYLHDGTIYTRMGYGSHSLICSGDSGGSMYAIRNGIPYVAGVHGFVSSYECNEDELAGSAIVSDHYDFIRSIVTDLPSDTPETNCNDGQDDNNDGRLDCEDPWCYYAPVCLTEVCDDGYDNNNDNLADCADPQCNHAVNCQPEVCNDNDDNNGNGKVDCDDPACADSTYCKPEICDDNIDNNGNDKVDCDDPLCANALICQPEICNDKIDNNGDNKADCADPKCASDPACQGSACDCSDISCNHPDCVEICDDKIDNNGDDKVDCDDPRCADVVSCKSEICNDGIDNNGDGIYDCDDASCADNDYCKSEICDDKIDNNGDGKTDCEDPVCAARYVCNPYEPKDPEIYKESACSASVHQNAPASAWAVIAGLLGLLGLCRRNRSRLFKSSIDK